MSSQNYSPPQPTPQLSTGSTTWIKADYEFASTFSYRIPGVSNQFAIGSPIPSPAAVKLALVDTAIRWSGDVNKGRKIFDLVKTATVCVIPPPRIVRFRAFIKRLKPRSNSLLESTGVRDYFLFEGPLSVYIQVPDSEKCEIEQLLQKIRRLGTTDSLCWCSRVRQESPPDCLCSKIFSHSLASHGQSQAIPLHGFPIRLKDLTTGSAFDGFNPFGGSQSKSNLCDEIHVLPVVVQRSGETWAILKRCDCAKQEKEHYDTTAEND